MDDLLFSHVGRALYRLGELAPLIDDLLAPSSHVLTGMPSGGSSRSCPPLRVPLLDLKSEIETELAGICAQAAAYCEGQQLVPVDGGIRALAHWLREMLPEWESAPWSSLVGYTLIDLMRLVGDVVDPDPMD